MAIKGCPYKQIKQSASIAISDYDGFREGTLSPYNPEEMPAKYEELVEVFKLWHAYFMTVKQAKDEGGKQDLTTIQAFRKRTRGT